MHEVNESDGDREVNGDRVLQEFCYNVSSNLHLSLRQLIKQHEVESDTKSKCIVGSPIANCLFIDLLRRHESQCSFESLPLSNFLLLLELS